MICSDFFVRFAIIHKNEIISKNNENIAKQVNYRSDYMHIVCKQKKLFTHYTLKKSYENAVILIFFLILKKFKNFIF